MNKDDIDLTKQTSTKTSEEEMRKLNREMILNSIGKTSKDYED